MLNSYCMEEELAEIIDSIDSVFDVVEFYYVGSYFLGLEYDDVDIKVVVNDLDSVKKTLIKDVNDCEDGFFWHPKVNGVTVDVHFVDDYKKVAYAVEITNFLKNNPDLLEKYSEVKKLGKDAKSKFIHENITLDKYCIVSLIKGNLGEFHNDLMNDVANKFKIIGAVKNKCPSHLTLKYSFIKNNISDIEEIVSNFSKKYSKCSFETNGFNSFPDNVIFMDIQADSKLKELQNELVQDLSSVLVLNQFDPNMNFHMTLANKDIGNSFDGIMSYVKTFDLPKGEFVFDNLTILKMSDDGWIIHKTYTLD